MKEAIYRDERRVKLVKEGDKNIKWSADGGPLAGVKQGKRGGKMVASTLSLSYTLTYL